MTEVFVTGCSGKKSFPRFSLAAKAARRRNRKDSGAHLEPYHCRHCNDFHVGEARRHGLKGRRKGMATTPGKVLPEAESCGGETSAETP